MRPQLAIHFPGPYDYWCRVAREDSIAAELADGHYSRQTPGAHGYMAPGQCVAFVHHGPRGRAVWGVVCNLDPVGNLRWRNTIFRNLSGTLSSSLIEAATIATYAVWRETYGGLPAVWRVRPVGVELWRHVATGIPVYFAVVLELVPLTTEIGVEATRARRSKRHEPGHCYRVAGWTEIRRAPPPPTRPARCCGARGSSWVSR